ncbi:MAG: 4-hydroxy-tetrahydrodipicolinate synthase [Gammaproteobacteria bacterium RIFCSPHIGHO2_12_FULL_35_23]|nr:MAG: 4-hydroxy-tetrahydrodipicolinate synthase [Gammaproteobacteria bacterium RIFCSPHIGHO2_12_FULL_35_23]
MNISGSIVALVTPMDRAGNIDFEAFEKLMHWHIQAGTNGIVVLGSTGEGATITGNERTKLIKIAVKEAAGQIPIIVGTGSNSTQYTIALTQEAQALGADACLIVAPYYNKPTQEGLYQHFKAIALAVEIPILLYNVPSRTVIDMKVETVGRLTEFKNIIGIKEATGEVARIAALRQLGGQEFILLSGDDSTMLEFILAGGNGVISITSNIAPKLMYEICTLAIAGKKEAAEKLNNRLLFLHKFLCIESNPIPVKWAMHKMGLIAGKLRLPLTELSTSYHQPMQEALQKAGLIN